VGSAALRKDGWEEHVSYAVLDARFRVPVLAECQQKLHCALLRVACQTCIHQIFYFSHIGVCRIITGVWLELLQMFQSAGKEREAKNDAFSPQILLCLLETLFAAEGNADSR